jgi:hypothetical protein
VVVARLVNHLRQQGELNADERGNKSRTISVSMRAVNVRSARIPIMECRHTAESNDAIKVVMEIGLSALVLAAVYLGGGVVAFSVTGFRLLDNVSFGLIGAFAILVSTLAAQMIDSIRRLLAPRAYAVLTKPHAPVARVSIEYVVTPLPRPPRTAP